MFELTMFLRSSMSSAVLKSWTHASRSGLLEWSSSWPLSWSAIRGNNTSLQSTSTEDTSLSAVWECLEGNKWDERWRALSAGVNAGLTRQFEKVALHHFYQTAELLSHHLKVWNALDKLRQLNAVLEESKKWKWINNVKMQIRRDINIHIQLRWTSEMYLTLV